MKKTLLIAGLVAAGLSAAAAVPAKSMPAFHGAQLQGLKTHTPMRALHGTGVNKAPNRVVENPDIITELPDGATEEFYYRLFHGVVPQQGQLMYASGEETDQVIAYGEDNKVYILDPIAKLNTGSYIEGTLSDDGTKITCQLPQHVLYYEDEGWGIDVTVGEWGVDEEGYIYTIDAEGADNVLTYDVNPSTGTVTMALPEGLSLYSIYNDTDPVYDGSFYGYMMDECKYSFESNFTTITAPDPDALQNWMMTYVDFDTAQEGDLSEKSGFVRGEIYDGEVYIAGLMSYLPENCVKGQIDGDKVSVKGGQYLGYFAMMGVNMNLLLVKYIMQDGVPAPYTVVDEVEGTLNAETGEISFADQNVGWFVNVGTSSLYYMNGYLDPSFKPIQTEAATPVDPVITDMWPFDEMVGVGCVDFDLYLKGTNGEDLIATNYTYCMYQNGEPWEFGPYYGLPEGTYQVPYTYMDTQNLNIYVQGEFHEVYFDDPEVLTIGVQAVYTVDGVEHRSNIVTVDATTALREAIADKVAVSADYFDLQGRPVANPANGLFLVRRTFADGTSSVAKVAK